VGFLFSAKAVIPSDLSLVAKVAWKRFLSAFKPSYKDVSNASLTAALAI
jgi:hypothetical protein